MQDEAKRLKPRQKDALVTASMWAAKDIGGVGAIPVGAISASSWVRLVELGLAEPLASRRPGRGSEYRLTQRGAELAARIAAKTGPGQQRRAKGASAENITAWVDSAEKAAVRAYAAANDQTVADAIREGLRAIGALP